MRFLGQKSKIFARFFASRKIGVPVVSSALAFARAGGRILRIRPDGAHKIFRRKFSPKISKIFFENFYLPSKVFYRFLPIFGDFLTFFSDFWRFFLFAQVLKFLFLGQISSLTLEILGHVRTGLA